MELEIDLINKLEGSTSALSLEEAIVHDNAHKIFISRNGNPATKLISVNTIPVEQLDKRMGIAKGMFEMPDLFEDHNEEITRSFFGEYGN